MYLTPTTLPSLSYSWVPPPLHDQEFWRIRDELFETAGISLGDTKKALVSSRLEGRLRTLGLHSYAAYLDRVNEPGADERQVMIDLLTTNETHFFREPRHFDFLRDHILRATDHDGLRVWSAACSTGEEVYSLAMTLAEQRPASDWQVTGTDISRRVLDVARNAIYPLASAEEIPHSYLSRYCLKGVRSRHGTFTIDAGVKERTEVTRMNLNGNWPRMQPYHVIFARNVMIYFDVATRRRLIDRFRDALAPGGYLIVGHAESMMVSDPRFACLRPSIYQLR